MEIFLSNEWTLEIKVNSYYFNLLSYYFTISILKHPQIRFNTYSIFK